MTDRLSVEVDREVCVGSRLCQMVAPEAFRLDEATGHAVVLEPEVDDEEPVWEAAEGCPREAIRLTSVATGRQRFP